MSSSRDETVEPIVIVEKSISVTSGEQIRPSQFVVHTCRGTDYVNINRCDKEWVRFLGFQGNGARQLADLDLWSQWVAAIEELRKLAFLDMKKDKVADDAEEALEAVEDGGGQQDDEDPLAYKRGIGRRAQLAWAKKHPFLMIALPIAPGSTYTHKVKVTNNQKVLGMSTGGKHFVWLRGYMQALHEERSATAPSKRQRVAV